MKQASEISVAAATSLAPSAATELARMAAELRHRLKTDHAPLDLPHIQRHWVPSAGTYCYHTHIAIGGQSLERLAWAAELFFNSASLESQPWYDQFLGGASKPCHDAPANGIDAHQLCLGRFDLGLGEARAYRQLVSLARPDTSTAVIIARSVPDGPDLPANTKLAYTVDPNGEVLHFDGESLHWHHICCTPGAALLPQPLDRYFINALRVCRLDGAERKTYREEAERFRDWVRTLGA